MQSVKLGATLTTLLIGVSAFAAPSPVGSWKGHLKITLPATLPAEQKAKAQQFQAQIEKAVISMTFKADHTFMSSISGTPNKIPNQNGKWTQVGTKISLSTAKASQTQDFTFSPDGKKLTHHQVQGGGAMDIVFTR